jgi:hypothetical protein
MTVEISLKGSASPVSDATCSSDARKCILFSIGYDLGITASDANEIAIDRSLRRGGGSRWPAFHSHPGGMLNASFFKPVMPVMPSFILRALNRAKRCHHRARFRVMPWHDSDAAGFGLPSTARPRPAMPRGQTARMGTSCGRLHQVAKAFPVSTSRPRRPGDVRSVAPITRAACPDGARGRRGPACSPSLRTSAHDFLFTTTRPWRIA